MGQSGNQPAPDRKQSALNLTLAAVVSQVGCGTALIILIALLVGLWLDNNFHTRPIFTIISVVASVPVTLVAMFCVVLKATARISANTPGTSQEQQE